MTEKLILVDEHDNQIGSAEKMEVHRKGLLHRCFSIFILHPEDGQMLLQQRANTKYHSGGLWTNACCGHPIEGEEIEAAAHRRLKEEMGFDAELEPIGKFHYEARLANGLTEHEIDHLLAGSLEGRENIVVDPKEVQEYKWEAVSRVEADLRANPGRYTPWLAPALALFLSKLAN